MASGDFSRARLVLGALLGVLAIWSFQLVFFHLAFSQTEKNFGERLEKLSLSARLVELTSRSTLLPEEEARLRSYARRLAELTRTPRGRELSRRLAEAVDRFLSLPPGVRVPVRGELAELARENDAFQRRRLEEEVVLVGRDFRRLFGVVAATSGAAFLLSGAVVGLLWMWLSRQMELNQLVVRCTRNAVLVGDRQGRVALVNPVFAGLAGKTPGELTGLPLENAGPTGALLARRIRRGEEVIGREVLWQTADGCPKCFSVDVILLKDREPGAGRRGCVEGRHGPVEGAAEGRAGKSRLKRDGPA